MIWIRRRWTFWPMIRCRRLLPLRQVMLPAAA
jgi:hypothetical protein